MNFIYNKEALLLLKAYKRAYNKIKTALKSKKLYETVIMYQKVIKEVI